MILTTDINISNANLTAKVAPTRQSFPKTVVVPANNDNSGYWNLSEKTVSKTPGTGYILIENIDYRNWRSLHNKGGDFRIYSDVMEESVTLKIAL